MLLLSLDALRDHGEANGAAQPEDGLDDADA